MFSRIRSVIDVERMLASRATLIGAGGSFTLAANLVRCGLGAIDLYDPQRIELANVARQDHTADTVGTFKVAALKQHLLRINPHVQVAAFPVDFCALSDDELNARLTGSNLLIAATDFFPAQARVNEAALRLSIPALFIGLYPQATVGEVIFWHPDMAWCFRCLTAKRYEAQERARSEGRSLDPLSDGSDIFSIQLLDAIAGQLALGLLTRGADNRFGSLIDQLADRNFISVKLDPTYTWTGRDIFREQLKIPTDCDTYFAWNTTVRRDPDRGLPPCPDCVKYRGRTAKAGFEEIPFGVWG